jgi:hypothetical protein
MQEVARLVGQSVNKQIRIVVQRTVSAPSVVAEKSNVEGTGAPVDIKTTGASKEIVQLTITPHSWGGRGLLGCHLSTLR